MAYSVPETDVFLTHDWGEDEHKRDNHQRVAVINELLNRRGYRCWFDEIMMEGELIKKMVAGINGTRCVLVFVTRRYMNKINGLAGTSDDNCKMEYEYSLRTKTTKNMICIVMEESMTNPSAWEDNLLFTMGGSLFIAMNGNLEDKDYVTKQMNELEKQLRMKGITPSQVMKCCSKCDIIGDGKFCYYCGNGLQDVETGKAKNYCSYCNTHGNGLFCSNCGKKLPEIGESKKVGVTVKLEEFEKLKGSTKLEGTEAALQEKIEGLQNENKKLQNEKNELEVEYIKKETEYQEQTQTRENEALEKLKKKKEQRKKKEKREKNKVKEAEASYEKRISALEEENKKLKENFVTPGECLPTGPDLPNYETTELSAQNLKIAGASIDFGCIEKLVNENKVEQFASYIDTSKEILKMHDNESTYTPFLYAAQFGTPDMLRMLQGKGADGEETIKYGCTAMHFAARAKKTDNMKWLCETYPQLVNSKNTIQQTPLHDAASFWDNLQCVRYLLAHGADATLVDREGKTPYDHAYNPSIKKELKKWMKD